MGAGASRSGRRIETFRRGDHVLAWCDGPEAVERVMAGFLRSAFAHGDLVALVVPTSENPQIRGVFSEAGLDFGRLKSQGRFVLWDAETWYPLESRYSLRVGMFLDILRSLAEAWQGKGISFVGRVAPSLLENGDLRRGLQVEDAIHRQGLDIRIVCPIDARLLPPRARKKFRCLASCHTHVLRTAEGAGPHSLPVRAVTRSPQP